MKLCFFGASKFGLRCLESILEIPEIKISGILTSPSSFKISYSPDRPVKNILYADFHRLARECEIPIMQLTTKMTNPDVINFIKKCDPEFILVIGWYHMVPRIIRKIPQKGIAGIHASLLPLYRGGAPLVWAIINGEQKTGLSLFYFDEGVDTGDLIGQREVTIKMNDTIATIYERIEEEGIKLLKEMLPQLAIGTPIRKQQPKGDYEIYKQRRPENGVINWSASSLAVYNYIRAQTYPYPGAFTFIDGEKLIIWEAKFYDFKDLRGKPGQIIEIIDNNEQKGFLVATGNNDIPLLVTKVGREYGQYIGALDYGKKRDIKGKILG